MKNELSINEIILLLSHHPKIGSQTIKKVLLLCNHRVDIFENLNLKDLVEKFGEKLANYIIEAKTYNLDKIKNNLKKHDIGYITLFDKEYPKLLAEIPDHPAILFIKGNAKALDNISISIVGSRKYSFYGNRIAKSFAQELSLYDIVITSGLALGIDSIAHNAVVEQGKITIAVLGCGLDRVYPTSNKYLSNKIIDFGGSIISEYPPGTEPFKSNFPARNRIIAGLSQGTLVVEAAKDSGALISAMAALDYNRDVYSVPGPIDSPSSEGTNWLIQQGAKLVTKVDDILDEMRFERKKLELIAKKTYQLTEEEKTILEIVKGSMNADDIVRASSMNVAKVSYILTMLEMKGILENIGGTWKKKI